MEMMDATRAGRECFQPVCRISRIVETNVDTPRTPAPMKMSASEMPSVSGELLPRSQVPL